MKNLFILLALLLPISAHAATPSITGPSTAASPVKTVIPVGTACSSMTIQVSGTAIEVTGNTTVASTTYGANSVMVMNLDTANTVYCSGSSGVTSSGNTIGVPIAYSAASGTRNWLSWMISIVQPWYCVAASAPVSIMVCLSK